MVVMKLILDIIKKLGAFKPAKGEPQGYNLKLTLVILELMMKSKKKSLINEI